MERLSKIFTKGLAFWLVKKYGSKWMMETFDFGFKK